MSADDSSVVPVWSRPLLFPVAQLYGALVTMRSEAYRHGWLPTRRLPCPVISVGNLTVGGTGKTPLVIWIVQRLLEAGRRVAVLSRGYRRRAQGNVLVSDGQRLLVPPEQSGDEPFLIAQACPGAVVAVGRKRYELGVWVLQQFALDCCVLDDGFQHLGLHRQVNLLLVDANDLEGLQALLPAGRLREPLRAARRATAVLLTRAEGADDRAWQKIRPYAPDLAPPFRVAFRGDFLCAVGAETRLKLEEVAGQKVLLFSGIARPRSFRQLLEQHGVQIVDELIFQDHHAYDEADLAQVRARAARAGADLIITTEKDAVKVRLLLQPGEGVFALHLRTDILERREALEQLVLGRDA